MKNVDVAYIDMCVHGIRIGKNVEVGKMMNRRKKQTNKRTSKNGHSKSRQRGFKVANGRHICFL